MKYTKVLPGDVPDWAWVEASTFTGPFHSIHSDCLVCMPMAPCKNPVHGGRSHGKWCWVMAGIWFQRRHAPQAHESESPPLVLRGSQC